MTNIQIKLDAKTVREIVEQYINMTILAGDNRAKATFISSLTEGMIEANQPNQALSVTFDVIKVAK